MTTTSTAPATASTTTVVEWALAYPGGDLMEYQGRETIARQHYEHQKDTRLAPRLMRRTVTSTYTDYEEVPDHE